jgi:SAM-dependent methyltransferase
MGPVETYLSEMRELRSARAGVKEITYYTALANLLDEVGKTLKPRVRCVLQLQNRGGGNPDGGLFTADQFPKGSDEPAGAGIPSRGVIEIKSTSEDAWITADGEQVSKYWGRYNQVLVTNYRDFVLVGRDSEGRQIKLETYRLARDEAQFWSDARHPGKKAALIGQSFIEFLKRALLLAAPLDSAPDLAWFLASYAHEAKFRIEHGEYPGLATVRTAVEEALGMTFEGTKGDHFFRSTLVQTLFYGMFSAWVLWSKSHPSRTARFDWRLSDQHLRVPILRKLFREVADPGSMESMDLNEVLDWAAATLNRVERGKFFETFEERHAVQYFYEPFLEAFDPELRKDLGVWYTPTEIVDYMVERVDRVLREELGLPDGLADKNVYVLDPCCGTGAYLVSVLNRIAETLREKGGDALLAQDLKEAAIQRVFGFEILPAPFVVAHLQLGLLMQHLGAPFADRGKKERASVFLTNSLTGWEPLVKPKKLPFVELEEERDRADEVKREKPILVILGNPPYNSFAGIAKVTEERGLSEAYRVAKKAPTP